MDCTDALVALLASVIVGLCAGAAAAASYRMTSALCDVAERALYRDTYNRNEAMLLSGVSMLYGAAAAAWVRNALRARTTIDNPTLINPQWCRPGDIPPPYGQGNPPAARVNPRADVAGELPPFWFGPRVGRTQNADRAQNAEQAQVITRAQEPELEPEPEPEPEPEDAAPRDGATADEPLQVAGLVAEALSGLARN